MSEGYVTDRPEMANGHVRTEALPVRFGTAQGNVCTHEWAEWMLTEWRNADLSGARPPRFGDVLQRAAVHFMMEQD